MEPKSARYGTSPTESQVTRRGLRSGARLRHSAASRPDGWRRGGASLGRPPLNRGVTGRLPPRRWDDAAADVEGGPAGYWGDWRGMVFNQKGSVEWGGDYSTRSPEVSNYLANEVAVGDVVVAYQTNLRSVVGYCSVAKVTGQPGARKLWLQPFEVVDPPLAIHDHKAGSLLERSIAVNGPVMLRELSRAEMQAIIDLAGSPHRVLRGLPVASGWAARQAPPGAYTA